MSPDPERAEPELRVVFLGTPEAAVPSLRAVREAGYPIPLVVTRPDRRRGRGGKESPSPVKAAALDAGLEVIEPDDVNAPASVERIREAGCDLFLIVAYGRILKKPLLAVPRLMPMNLHFSLLPEYRGAAPVARALADGRTETGITLQRIVRKLDAGPILASKRVDIGPEETTGELEARLAVIGAELVLDTLRLIRDGTVVETPQEHDLATYAPMLTKEDGVVDWSRSAAELRSHVRAMDPWPGAQVVFSGAARSGPLRATLLRAEVLASAEGGPPPGEVLAAGPDGIDVQTGRGILRILELKPAGKRRLTAREFVNGYRVAGGDSFTPPA